MKADMIPAAPSSSQDKWTHMFCMKWIYDLVHRLHRLRYLLIFIGSSG